VGWRREKRKVDAWMAGTMDGWPVGCFLVRGPGWGEGRGTAGWRDGWMDKWKLPNNYQTTTKQLPNNYQTIKETQHFCDFTLLKRKNIFFFLKL
jgi:hypothetical protein